MSSPAPLDSELPTLTRFLRAVLLYGLMGASVGMAVWTMAVARGLAEYVAMNRLAAGSRTILLSCMSGFALTSVVVAVVLTSRRGLFTTERIARRALPLLLAGPLPLLVQYRLWLERDLTFLILVLLFCLTLERLLRAALVGVELPNIPFLTARMHRVPHLGLAVATLVAVSYAVYFSVMTIRSHYNFCTSSFDLGIEDNLVWNAAHGEALFRTTPLGGSMRHGGFHQTYFSYLLAPIYRLVPRAETLLVLQSSFLGAAAVPLYLVARRHVGSAAGVLVCLLYALYAPLHGANLYDFHYQPFAVFFVPLLFFLLDTRRDRAAAFVTLVLLSVREDMGVLVVALGAFLALSGRRPIAGITIGVAGLVHFVLLKLVIMPRFLDGESSYAHIYASLLPDGERGFGGVLKTLAGNPSYVLSTLLTEEKLVYALQIFVPVLLLPLRSASWLLLLVPGALFTLLSTGYPATLMTSFQYTAYWTPMVFLSTVLAIEKLGRAEAGSPGRGSRRTWLVALAAALLLTSNRFGAVLQRETARGAFDLVRLTVTPEDHRNHADAEALVSQIPGTAKVVATEWLVSHISNRRDAYNLRIGTFDAEYLLFWIHPKLRHDERPLLRTMLSKRGDFGVVDRRGVFVLAQRGHSQALNGSVLRDL